MGTVAANLIAGRLSRRMHKTVQGFEKAEAEPEVPQLAEAGEYEDSALKIARRAESFGGGAAMVPLRIHELQKPSLAVKTAKRFPLPSGHRGNFLFCWRLSMRRCLGLMFLAIMSTPVLIACGGDSSDPTEENLKARAEAFGTAIVDGNYSDLYEFAVPEMKSVCSKEEFLAGAHAEIKALAVSMELDEDAGPKAAIRALMGIDEDADVKVRASDVEVEGNQGSVLIEFYLDDVRFGAQGGDDSDHWVLTDGQWYAVGTIRSDGC